MSTKMAASTICVPGQRILRTDGSHIAGNGTYIRNDFIYSTLVGYLHTQTSDKGQTVLEVRSSKVQNVVPVEDDIVTARVTNVNPRFCKCSILSIGKTKLQEPFRGMLRKEDVRASEKSKVEMYKCFRPGDIIVAKVLSLGDAQSYLLSTAENEFGVVIATSEAGGSMVPISWCKMQCTKSQSEEYRKLSLGDAQSYLLSTAENEFGVVIATSEAGGSMVPISWCKMQCTKSQSEEYRKLSLGDAQSYLLSTAENEFGVVIATSEAGGSMVPISWCKMQCTKSQSEEYRKVAKVQSEYIEYSSS